MKQILDRQRIPATLVGLTVLLVVLLILLPAERTLGNIIKVVFLHGALVQIGLVTFGAAGLLGLVALAWNKESLYQWCLALQKTAVIVWIVYALSSMVSTYLAWGVAIAWEEPRVQASAKVLGTCVAFLVLTLWVNQRRFTAVVNVVLAVLAWVLTKGAISLRHPLNSIGSSDSAAFKWFFVAILVVTLLLAVQLARWLRAGSE